MILKENGLMQWFVLKNNYKKVLLANQEVLYNTPDIPYIKVNDKFFDVRKLQKSLGMENDFTDVKTAIIQIEEYRMGLEFSTLYLNLQRYLEIERNELIRKIKSKIKKCNNEK